MHEDDPEGADALPDELHERIETLSEQGNALMDEGEFVKAARAFQDAWNLLPAPKTEWEAATWLLAGLGDAAYFQGKFDAVRDAMEQALQAPGGLGNPFIHLRLGQALFELGELDRAADELMRAYMGDGEDVFEGADGKYLAFLRTRAQLN